MLESSESGVMDSNEKSALIITTMNEIEGLRTIWNGIPFPLFDQVIAVDRNSTDGTVEFLREQRCELLTQKLPGRGNAIREAIDQLRPDIVVLMASDGNDDPRYIPQLIAELKKGYDLVTGSRFAPGGRTDDSDDPLRIRRFGNKFFTFLVNLFWDAHLTDSTYGLRAFRMSAWNRMKIKATKNETEFLMSIHSAKLKLKTKEVPVVEGRRVGGEVKARSLSTGWSFTRIIVRELFQDPD